MASRTVIQMIASVQRELAGRASPGIIFKKLSDANDEIRATFPWPWAYKEANIGINAMYSTGTLSINDNTNTFTGVGTAWDTTWKYKKLSIGSNVDYLVSSFSGVAAGTLVDPIHTGQNWTNITYTIYQDMYPLPDDCDPGDVVVIVNPKIRYRLLHPPRYTLEVQQKLPNGIYMNNYQSAWTEAGYDETTLKHLIMVGPAPSATTELRIVYRQRTPALADLSTVSEIPEGYDKAIEVLTKSKCKQDLKDRDWKDFQQQAYQILQALRRKVTTQLDDVYQQYDTWPWANEVSMMDPMGLIISGPVSP